VSARELNAEVPIFVTTKPLIVYGITTSFEHISL